jgi:hypothetical protein
MKTWNMCLIIQMVERCERANSIIYMILESVANCVCQMTYIRDP